MKYVKGIVCAVLGASTLLLVIYQPKKPHDIMSPVTETAKHNNNITSSIRRETPPASSVSIHPTYYLTIHPLDGSAGRLGNFYFRYAAAMGIAKVNNMGLVLPDTRMARKLKYALNLSAPLLAVANSTNVGEKHWGIFDSDLFNLPRHTNITLNFVYSQSFKYFSDIEIKVKQEFTFNAEIHRNASLFIQDARKLHQPDYIIGIHVRRGDFLEKSHQEFGYAVATKRFFSNAIGYYIKKYGRNLLLIIASDDRWWCEREINFMGAKSMFARNRSAIEDLAMLTQCDHHVVSVGSFGWWGAWLGKGEVVYFKGFPTPGSRHSTNHKHVDYYPANWIGMD